jgi:hypothetical protein
MGRIVWFFVCALCLWGQHAELRIYSEFERLSTAGDLIDNTPGRTPQEIISPAVARNSFTSFHVAVTARPGILYWFAVQSNPPDVFGIKVYKESASSRSSVLDELHEEAKPSYFLGQMSANGRDVYLLDIWTPPDAQVRTVRFEVLVKEAYWVVAPMEIRIQAVRVPKLNPALCCDSLPAPDQPSDAFAWEALLMGFTGARQPFIAAPATVRSAIHRNALQDAALIGGLKPVEQRMLMERALADLMGIYTSGLLRFTSGGDAYLAIRRLALKLASDAGKG